MGDFLKVSGGAVVAVLVAGLAGQAREVRAPSGTFELERKYRSTATSITITC